MLKAHEVTTVFKLNGIDKLMVGKYIVIAKTTSKAGRLIPLRPTEQIVHAEEMNHIVIVEEEE
jgi:hypothetical protein